MTHPTRRSLAPWGLALALAALLGPAARADDLWLTVEAGDGPGKGKRVVLISGDEEYRSEESLPQLAKILAARHGFGCTVLFAINPNDGTIDPNTTDNIPGLEALAKADLMVIATRFRNLPNRQMKLIDEYVETGRPIIGMRTATHAFNILDTKPEHPYSHYSFNSKARGWDGGFGRVILGETWINHHGNHGHQSTRGILAPGASSDPIVKGIRSGAIWGPTDVYEVRLPQPADTKPLILGEVVEGMSPDDPPAKGPKNHPMMPVAWRRTYTGASGKPARVFATTMGAATDLVSTSLRRLLVNAAYWAVGLEDKIDPESSVGLVGRYDPTPFGFGQFKKGVRPSELASD